MAKKKSEEDLYKEFCRMCFSSLSGRRAKYLYTGPDMGDKYTLVLSNGGDDLIMAYNSSELALHIVSVFGEDRRFLDKFWEETKIPQDAFYQFDTEVFLKVQKMDAFDKVVTTPDGTMRVDLDDPKGPSILGRYVGNYYLAIIFRNLYEDLLKMDGVYQYCVPDGETVPTPSERPAEVPTNSSEHWISPTSKAAPDSATPIVEESAGANCPVQIFEINIEEANKGVTIQEVDTKQYLHPLTQDQIFANKQEKVHVILLDGLDVASLKELPKKLTGEPKVKLITWVGTGQFIRFVTVLEHERLIVRSSRPHLCIFPPFKYIEPSKVQGA